MVRCVTPATEGMGAVVARFMARGYYDRSNATRGDAVEEDVGMTSARNRILAAAIDLLGTGGARALTHRRVDERALEFEALGRELLHEPAPAVVLLD